MIQSKVELSGVNTARLKVLKSDETMELLRRSKATVLDREWLLWKLRQKG